MSPPGPLLTFARRAAMSASRRIADQGEAACQEQLVTIFGSHVVDAQFPLFFRRKILVGQWRRDWTLNAYKRLAGSRVAAIATAGKLVEGGRKFGTALCFN